jgi:hypothetical protein
VHSWLVEHVPLLPEVTSLSDPLLAQGRAALSTEEVLPASAYVLAMIGEATEAPP